MTSNKIDRISRREAASTVIIWLERLWSASWPTLGIVALFMAAAFWGGFLIFVAWQGTAGLLPGKNSSIKFMYIAWAVPFGVGTAAAQPISNRLFWVVLGLELLVAIAALPVSLNWP